MEKEEELEFFKLDEIDRKVFLWLLAHVPKKSTLAWIDYITDDYRRRRAVLIDGNRMFREMES
ncbi:MAG TPA: hypothetical protein VD816_14360 [Ohtaekwangia sp.]|nr:hypothetical protein [Ohtaekwangia sp.]